MARIGSLGGPKPGRRPDGECELPPTPRVGVETRRIMKVWQSWLSEPCRPVFRPSARQLDAAETASSLGAIVNICGPLVAAYWRHAPPPSVSSIRTLERAGFRSYRATIATRKGKDERAIVVLCWDTKEARSFKEFKHVDIWICNCGKLPKRWSAGRQI